MERGNAVIGIEQGFDRREGECDASVYVQRRNRWA